MYCKRGYNNDNIRVDNSVGEIVCVATKAILDAVKNHLKVVKQDVKYGTTFKYVSKYAVIVINEAGEVVTTYVKGSAGLRGVR